MIHNVHITILRDSVFANRGKAACHTVGSDTFDDGWERRIIGDPECDPECVSSFHVDGSIDTDCGDEERMFYTYELANSQGASYLLFREPLHTDAHVRAAKRSLRRDFDVVSIRVFRIDEWITPQPAETSA